MGAKISRPLLPWWLYFVRWTPEVFPCFFLSHKVNSRVKLVKTGHGPHSSTLVVICVVLLLLVSFYVLFVCKCVLPSGDNQIAVNKCININIFVGPYYGTWFISPYFWCLEFSGGFCLFGTLTNPCDAMGAHRGNKSREPHILFLGNR